MRALLSLALGCLLSAPGYAEPVQPQGRPSPQGEDPSGLPGRALGLTDPRAQQEALAALKALRFRSLKDPAREKALHAQAILEDRLGRPQDAAATFHRLERAWPRSPLLADGQVILAGEAVERQKFKEAEDRLRKSLAGDLPVEAKRKAQELLLWVLVEARRPDEGLAVLKNLTPLSAHSQPSERGLAAMVQVLCAAKDRSQADGARKDYHSLYPGGPNGARVDMAWARLAGALGDATESAQTLRSVIVQHPRSAEADEARLALATLLTEGRLPPEAAANFPSPDKLLAELTKAERNTEPAKKALMVKLRLATGRSAWAEVIALVAEYRGMGGSEAAVVADLRAKAVRALAQQCLEQGRPGAFLGLLEAESVDSLTPDQRLQLVRRFARGGLPEPAEAMMALSPPGERGVLRSAALEELPSGIHLEETGRILGPKVSSPTESLRRLQILLAGQDWAKSAPHIPRAAPGSERIACVVRYLGRPLDGPPAARLKEAESYLGRAPEKGRDREALAIFVADLRAKAGDWRGALALYPVETSPEQRAWVALMRATCLGRLGQKEAARQALESAAGLPGFKAERERLARQLQS
ncbi:MAG: hypothetical protein HY823_02295 [Acidobacteria bacterium]|nr:hypothetical protein [Acidobacteriota bacterium]